MADDAGKMGTNGKSFSIRDFQDATAYLGNFLTKLAKIMSGVVKAYLLEI